MAQASWHLKPKLTLCFHTIVHTLNHVSSHFPGVISGFSTQHHMLLLTEQQLLGAFCAGQLNDFTHEPSNWSDVAGIPVSPACPHHGLTSESLSGFHWGSEANALVNWCGQVSVWERHVSLAPSLGFHADLVDTVQISLTHRGSSYALTWSLVCNVTHTHGFPRTVRPDKTKSSHLS